MHNAVFYGEGGDVAPLAFGYHAEGVTAGGSPCTVKKTVGEAEEIAIKIDLIVVGGLAPVFFALGGIAPTFFEQVEGGDGLDADNLSFHAEFLFLN